MTRRRSPYLGTRAWFDFYSFSPPPGLTRGPRLHSRLLKQEDVDGRVKPGQGDTGKPSGSALLARLAKAHLRPVFDRPAQVPGIAREKYRDAVMVLGERRAVAQPEAIELSAVAVDPARGLVRRAVEPRRAPPPRAPRKPPHPAAGVAPALANYGPIRHWLVRLEQNDVLRRRHGAQYEHFAVKSGNSSRREVDNCHYLTPD